MKAAFRLLPYCYLLLALLYGLGVTMVASGIALAYQAQDEDLMTPVQLVPLFTFALAGTLFVIAWITNAVLLLRKVQHKLSVILAWVTCLAFPFGTMLGAVSIFLLTRSEIRDEYTKQGAVVHRAPSGS